MIFASDQAKEARVIWALSGGVFVRSATGLTPGDDYCPNQL